MGNTSKLYYSFFQKHIRPSGYTDTTFICNKLGEDLASYNPHIKHLKYLKYQLLVMILIYLYL